MAAGALEAEEGSRANFFSLHTKCTDIVILRSIIWLSSNPLLSCFLSFLRRKCSGETALQTGPENALRPSSTEGGCSCSAISTPTDPPRRHDATRPATPPTATTRIVEETITPRFTPSHSSRHDAAAHRHPEGRRRLLAGCASQLHSSRHTRLHDDERSARR